MEAEIIKAVKETENGVSIEAVCRSHGIARGTLYNWRVKYGGMDVSQLKALQEENQRLKQMYADMALDNKILRDVIEKNFRARGQERDCIRDSGGI